MNLLAYIRVSTEDQAAHGHSLGQQLDRLRAYAALHGHQLVDVITDEGVSASVALGKRQGGAQVLAGLKRGVAAGVVVVRLDRLFRNALDGLRFFEEDLAALDACVHSVSELIDTSTPSGWLSLIMQLATADYARRLDVQRGRETNKALREQGKVYGAVPYGCVAVGGETYFDDVKRKRRVRGAQLQRDPTLWEVREQIVAMHRVDGLTLRTIVERLRAAGTRSPNGARGWSLSTLKNLIDTHESLTHLPMIGRMPKAVAAAREARVSAAMQAPAGGNA